MNPSNHNPENFVRIFGQYVKAIVQFLIWIIIGFSAIATAYVTARVVLVAVKAIFTALGV